jgi:hypothetical protein
MGRNLKEIDTRVLGDEFALAVGKRIATLQRAIGKFRCLIEVASPDTSLISRLAHWARTGRGMTATEVDAARASVHEALASVKTNSDVYLVLVACNVRLTIGRGAPISGEEVAYLCGVPKTQIRRDWIKAPEARAMLVERGVFEAELPPDPAGQPQAGA